MYTSLEGKNVLTSLGQKWKSFIGGRMAVSGQAFCLHSQNPKLYILLYVLITTTATVQKIILSQALLDNLH